MVNIVYRDTLCELIGKSSDTAEAATVKDVLTFIKGTYGKDAYKLAKKLLITVNGDGITILNNMRTRLSPGDTVSFLPICGGG